MRVFVTGATGWVGSAVVKELVDAGHDVLGLTRSEAGAQALVDMGADVHHGSLEDLDSLKAGVAATEAVIHTAFNHDFSRFLENCEEDRRAIEAMGAVLEGRDRRMIVTSGVAMLAPNGVATEADRPGDQFPRKSEAAADALVARGINVSVVRLAPSVHGQGDHGFVPILVNLARQQGAAAYVGEGLNRWAGVHRSDAARLYRLALERSTPGARYHATAEEGVPFRDLAGVIGRGLDLPVVSRTAEAAEAHFGWFARFAGMNMAASSAKTRELLDWTPTGPGLLEDVAQPSYFAG